MLLISLTVSHGHGALFVNSLLSRQVLPTSGVMSSVDHCYGPATDLFLRESVGLSRREQEDSTIPRFVAPRTFKTCCNAPKGVEMCTS